MSPSEILSARMTKASYINLTEGSHAAQAYANAHIPGFRLDHSLTTEHQSVFYNKETGELRLAYRGTQAGRDWVSTFKMGVSATQYASQVRDLEKSMQRVIAKYGTNGKLPPNTVINGHSKGGGQALHMAEKYGVTSHTQDPYVPIAPCNLRQHV